MKVTILDRLRAALHALETRNGGPRQPKAFYLNGDDWREFEAVAEELVTVWFGNNPAVERVDRAFCRVPVRPSTSALSRLYDHAGYGHNVHRDPADGRPAGDIPMPADLVVDALDKLSRTRALDERESLALEAAIKGRVILTHSELARLGIKA